MLSRTKNEIYFVLDNYHQTLLTETIKAAPDKSHFFLTRLKFFGHLIEGNTMTPLKTHIDAIIKLQPPSNKKKTKNFLECLTFYVNTSIKCN